MNKENIDTSSPFRSVKEAVSLYSHNVVVAAQPHSLFTTTTNLIQSEANENGIECSRHVELEEMRQELERAKEENMSMAYYLSSLEDELQRTKQELLHLKNQQQTAKRATDDEPDIEQDINVFVQNLTQFHTRILTSDDEEENIQFEKHSWCENLANSPSFAHHGMPPLQGIEKLERHPSLGNNKMKKKPLVPLIGAIFSRKRRN